MSDVLSQEEIDKLLRDLADGNNSPLDNEQAVEKKVKAYNFARPSKFGREQLRTLEVIFESFSRLASSYFTGYFRNTVQIEVANAEQMTYNEFSNSLLNPVILGIVDFKPMKGSIILELSAPIGYAIIDRILGGSGEPLKKTREFTEIEKVLLSKIITQMVTFLPEPWENVCAINPKFEKLETNAQFAQIISPNEMVALVTLSIKIGEIAGMINFCIPHMVIEPIMPALNTKNWFAMKDTEENEAKSRPIVEQTLKTARVPISAVVGRTTINVDEFINLQVGDVITLDSYVNSDFSIMVGDLLKFYGKPGLKRGKNAIQITSVIRKEE